MDTFDELSELRKKAEEAVADMPEGELKTKAFEVILQHLLSTRATPTQYVNVDKKQPIKKIIEPSRAPGTRKSRILLLKDEGFFTIPRTLSQVEQELKAHGWIHVQTALSGPLQSLVQERHLRRISAKVRNKKVWNYVNP